MCDGRSISYVRHCDCSGSRSTVNVFDTTLRDGEQTPGVHLRADQKIVIAQRLEAIGVSTIEAGFPASSPGDYEAVLRIAELIQHCEVAALARCTRRDIDAVAGALQNAKRPVAHLVLGVSDIHLKSKMNMSRAEALRTIRESVTYARERLPLVQFSLEDATRTERPYLRQAIQVAVEAGATRINIADTVGCALPWEFGDMISDIVELVGPDVVVSAHCHNDIGMATANTIAAVMHGARQFEVTVNGIGERAGNASLEEVSVALALKGIATTGIELTQLTAISETVSEATGVPIQPNRAIVGANAFAHSSGIHQDGIIKNPANYEFVPPKLVGAPGHKFIMTARSGRSAIAHIAAQAGHTLTPAETDKVYQAFLIRAEAAQGAIDDREIESIIAQVITGSEKAVASSRESAVTTN